MKKKQAPRREVRTSHQPFEIRRNPDGSQTIVGYASVFAPAFKSQDMGGWVEEIDRHAFDDCLATNPDVRALFNHDQNWVLGRTKSGTLKLSVDSVGLRYEITPNLESTQSNDVLAALKRGDIDQSSFAMVCKEDDWRIEDGGVIRRVLQADLYDVSPVTYPAYPDATSGLRASLRSCPADIRCRINRDDLNDDDDDSDYEDYRPECDEDSEDYDPDADCPGQDDDDDDDNEEEDNSRRDSLRIRTLFAHRMNISL
jgi:uncharacterized protein